MTANKYLQKILEIHGLDIKTIGGRSDGSNIEDNSIGGGLFSRFKKNKVGTEPDVAHVSHVDINNNVSCINDQTYMDKVTKLLLKMKENMTKKKLTHVVLLNKSAMFVSILKGPLKIDMDNDMVNHLEELFAQLMTLQNEEVTIQPTVIKIVETLQSYFKNCDHVFRYIDLVIDATLKHRLTVTKPNIKQLPNGINPSYGGGFILFDSEFKAQNIIHTNYSNTNDILIHQLSLLTYDNVSKDTFMQHITDKENTLLEVSKLVSEIQKTVLNMKL
jgi:hypothetical protein